MEKYDVMDIFSYSLSIEDVEDVFQDHFSGDGNKYPEYCVTDYYEGMGVSGDPLGAINELLDSDRKVALIRKDQELIAIVGYTIKDAGEKR